MTDSLEGLEQRRGQLYQQLQRWIAASSERQSGTRIANRFPDGYLISTRMSRIVVSPRFSIE
jgi:hypothetical protein